MEKHIEQWMRANNVSSLGSLSYPATKFKLERGRSIREGQRQWSKGRFSSSGEAREDAELFLQEATEGLHSASRR